MTKKPKITDIPGIGEKMEESLRNAGIKTVLSLSKADPEKLAAKVGGLGVSSAEDFISEAKKLLPQEEPSKEKKTGLEDITGVGPKTQESLRAAGYETVEKIAIADPVEIAEKVEGVGDATADQIVEAALELVPDDVKKKRKPRLSDITGVGPKTQDALRTAGYNTVEKIAIAEPADIAEKADGIGDTTADQIVEAALELVPDDVKKKRKPRLSDITGVGPKTQDALRAAGYKTVSMIANADSAEIAEKVEGVGDATADNIVEVAQSLLPTKLKKKKAKKKPKKKAPKKKEKKPEFEFAGGKARHDQRLLRIAARKKKRKPKFRHEQAHRWKRVSDSWRKVRGIDSATREKKKGRPAMVSAGYRTPKEIRGLHPSGYEEVLVHRPADLDGLDPEVQAIRIGGTVGMKKRQDILDKADTMFLRVLNPGVPEEVMEEDLFEELEGLEDMEAE
ncbi:50S ribosomal protein L32e [Candidatus Thorarchaeota archaeon]|nr:MAG: 50S ribosomal protein L32e [Candidatus Thorarchaeota archaeon]